MLVAALPMLTDCNASAPAPDPVNTDSSQLVAAGVARVQWDSGAHLADLNITQWTGLDAMIPSETRCRGWSTSGHPLFFDLNWRAVRNKTPVAGVTLSMSTTDGRPLMIAPPQTGCVPMSNYRIDPLPPLDGEQFVLQLFTSSAEATDGMLELVITFNGHREVLPLYPACTPDKGQGPSRTCTIDPVSFDEGAPYSQHWNI